MRVSKYDDLIVAKKCFELGLTIKEWSRDKSLRDMHARIPDFIESSNYQDFLIKMQMKLRTDPSKVVRMKDTMRMTQILMHGQDRNSHGKMFGGYLMREAFEISWITAVL